MLKNYLLLFSFLVFQILTAQGTTDVFTIARSGSVAEAKAVFQSNPKAFLVKNEHGFSPLVLACYRGNTAVAKFLIDNGSDIDEVSPMGTPLMAVVVKGNLEIAKVLLDKKANANAADANGITALIYAVKFQNIPLTKLLLDYKADKTHLDKEGKSAFEYAVFTNNSELIQLLK